MLVATAALGLSFCGSVGGQAQAQSGKSSKTASKSEDPQARSLFDEVCKAYRALSSYSDDGRFVIAMTIGGRQQKQEMPLKLTLVRPNKIDLDTGAVRLLSDGTTMTTAAMPLKRVAAEPAPSRIEFDTFREGPLGAILFGGPARVPVYVLLNMLTAPNPAAAISQLGGSLQIAPADVRAKGSKPPADSKSSSSALLIDMVDGPDVLLTVDPATKLLSEIELKLDPERLAQSAPAGRSVSVERFGWSSGAVSTHVAPDRSFAFEPPGGFSKVDSILGKKLERAHDERVGKPAPDFTLTVLDGPGKTRTLTKAELAGKILVFAFWATWCEPCFLELPEIQKFIETYANSQSDVLVVAVNQDSEPSEIGDVRKLVEKSLSEKKIELAGKPAGRIALDPSNSIGRAFKIYGFPTLCIIDATGTIQSVHEGFDAASAEPLHKSLAKEIDALRQRKRATGSNDEKKQAPKDGHSDGG
jgi:thiol-disulfide isomerase/thioredoxin